jgi:hypothetical protein
MGDHARVQFPPGCNARQMLVWYDHCVNSGLRKSSANMPANRKDGCKSKDASVAWISAPENWNGRSLECRALRNSASSVSTIKGFGLEFEAFGGRLCRWF